MRSFGAILLTGEFAADRDLGDMRFARATILPRAAPRRSLYECVLPARRANGWDAPRLVGAFGQFCSVEIPESSVD